MNLKNKKILITGAGGFIGSHLTEEIVKMGSDVRAFVHYNSRSDWGLIDYLPDNIKNNIEIIAGDIQDPFSIKKAVQDVDVVFHLAALIGIPYSYTSPESYINVNVVGTLNILQVCLEEGVEKIVHTSTSETYGSAQYVPIDEKHPVVGQSPYSASKIGADKMAESYYASFDLPVAIIRPFNTFGPRQSARAIIPTIISQALSNEKMFLGSLHPTRDYTYVKDTVRGFIKIAESPDSIGETINIGSNFELSMGSLVEKIINIVGKKVEIVSDDIRIRPEKSEVQRLWCNNTKAKELLGWTPTISLEKGLEETIEWISEHLDIYKPDIYNR